MAKVLMIHPEKCLGCRTCELACSFQHEGRFRPGASRIAVNTWDREGFSVPLMCQQCDEAACVNVCPTGAMHHSTTNPKLVEHDKRICIGCKMCVIACPFGAARWDSGSLGITKCDTCNGSPQCVQFCPSGALEYVEDAGQTRERRRAIAEKLKIAVEEVEPCPAGSEPSCE
jgi:Fe-S-cluster-containing hydrogenase component 2